MADLIVAGGTVITMDAARRVIGDGAVAVKGGRIIAVGPRAEVEAAHDADRTIDATGKIVMPGLIDVHAHAGHGLIKTMGMERHDDWEAICGEVYTTGSTPEFWYAEARLAALERLRFGVTTGVSLLGGGDTIMRTDDPAYADAHCRAVSEVGTRSVVAIGPTRPPHPRIYARWAGGKRTDYSVSFERQLQTCAEVLNRWHGAHDMRVRIALLFPVLRDEHERDMTAADYDEAVRQAQIVRALSRDAGVIFTQDGHSKGSALRADRLGLLGPDALLSHAIDFGADEIAVCAITDTKIAHNPSAIASIMGRCPAIEMIEAGVTVAIGSDATAPDRSADMFRHMQQAMHYHRRHFRDSSVLPPGKALEMVTVDAARALGLEAEIGSIAPGTRADIILVDMERPHLYPPNMPVFHLVYFANGNDVDTVIVGGEVVLENREATRASESDILDNAAVETERMIDRIGGADMLGLPEGFWGQARYPARTS